MILLNIPLRFKNKAFWVTFIPAVFLLIQAVANMFGVKLELEEWQDNLLHLVDVLFIVLALLGIPLDFTTKGVSDSERVLVRETTAPNAADTIRYTQEEVKAKIEKMEE